MKSQHQDSLTFGVVVYDTDKPNSDIDKAIDSLKTIDYPKDKVIIVISSFQGRGISYLVEKINDLQKYFNNSFVVINTEGFSKNVIDYNAFRKCGKVDYFVKLTEGDAVSSDMFKKINESFFSGERIVAFKENNVVAFPFRVVSTQYLKHKDFEDMKESVLQESKTLNMFKSLNEET